MNRLSTLLALLSLAASPALAGPCTEDIAAAQTRYSQRLDAAAASGPTATETTAAKLHHQPTPGSVAQAEARVGDLKPEAGKQFDAAISRARAADAAGDAATCKAALNDAAAALKS